MNLALKYYGVDWIGTVFTLAAIYMLGSRQRNGFVIMIFGNLSWIALGVFINSLAMILSNVIFIAMNIRGFVKWSAKT